jgi:enoyl-CoA hydratase/carnithine racemase
VNLPTLVAEGHVLAQVEGGLGVVTLNRAAALNALSLPMIRDITSLLLHWQHDDAVNAVWIEGRGREGKAPAFCAGGDIRFFHQAALAGDPKLEDFFTEEYALNHLIHCYPKPYVAAMDGITMGGGMGLGQAARLRIVTERTKIAMPETRIGFLPDVGGTRFLSVMPAEIELYVGLTGVTLTGAEALRFQLADLCVPSEWLDTFEERLSHIPTADASADDLMRALRTVFEPPCNVVPHAGLGAFTPLMLRHFDRRSGVERIVASLRQDLEREHSREICQREVRQWLQATCDAMTSHSPTMLYVTRDALLRGRQMTLAECFRMELGIVARVIEDGDFSEGVRAHLVDKDRKPRWAPATLAEVRPERVRHLLASPWRVAAHPLADLGAQQALA